MEHMIRSIRGSRNVGTGNIEVDNSEMEVFCGCIDRMFSKVNEFEQRVDAVERYYADNKELNTAKCSSILKDKIKKKHLMTVEKQQEDSEKTTQDLMRQFAVIFRQITQHKWAWPFLEPVDVEGLCLHDYYEVIEKPMDFSTIKNRMEAKDGSGYKNVREIYADVRLVFKNAMKYNDERDDVHVMARTLLEKFEEKWLQLLPKVAEEEKRREKEQTATQVATKLAEEASYANMAQDLSNELHGVDMQLERIREMVVHNSRKISTEEKKKLGTALTQLSHQDLIRALEIVAEHNPSFQATAQEVNLDMDTQSDVTLWRLKVFVQDALKVSGRNSGGAGMGCNSNINNDDNNGKININNKNRNTTASKRKGERCDAVTKASAKKTKKISLNSLNP
ncbi:transcription factor GTE1 isoform X1 [Populus alba x Populus x berolinensis]|nr:transcription factor GTE1 isoform X1 [Populus alba x Populus x berolinensis]